MKTEVFLLALWSVCMPVRAGNAVLTNSTTPAVSAATSAIAESPGATPRMHVRVDPRVELFSLMFRLAGNPEYNQAKVESYTADVEEQFGVFRDEPVVQLARRLRATRGISYDACMSMAVHLIDAYELEPIVPLVPWPEGLDERWTPEATRDFLALAREFVQKTSFNEFIEKHQPFYETTALRLRTLLEKEARLEWFHEYFGERAEATFTVVPGLLNGGSCYGAHCRDASGRDQLYCILGVWKTDGKGLPEFTFEMLSTVVHEFCHSYANTIVDRHEDELAAAGKKLFQFVADKMRSQAYGTPQTMLRESLVRACTVRYHHRYEGAAAAERAVKNEELRGFAWTGELSKLLAEYEAQRDRYPTLETFSPRLIAFFIDYADKFADAQTTVAAHRPQVVSMVPANGSVNVDPGLNEIQVMFDRPMQDGSWSMVGGGPQFPEIIGRPRYDSNRTTWTVQVKLKPEWPYQFYLNRGRYDSFRSDEGVPLEPVHVTFTTTGRTASNVESPVR